MAKILGMTEATLKGLGGLFLAGYLFAMFSAYLNLKQGEPEGAKFLFTTCTIIALLPAIAFMYLGVQLQRKRVVLESVNQFLRNKARVSAQEVATQFGWSEMEAEEKIVEVLSEEMILGHFDRGTKQFYVQGAQENMDFVDKCANCGADVGMWVSKVQPSKCPYCESEVRGTFEPPPQMEIRVSTQSANVTVGATSEAPTGEEAPQQPSHIVESTFSGKAQQPMVAERPAAPPAPPPAPTAAPPTQAPQTQAPVQYAPPAQHTPPAQAPAPGMAPAPAAAPTMAKTQVPYDHFAQGKKKGTIKYLFFSLKPGAMKTVGYVFLFFGILFTGATLFVGYDMDGFGGMLVILVLMIWLWGPFVLIGALLLRKAYTHGRYRTELVDISDFLVTYRKIDFVTLARKMQLPDERVRKIIDDILAFELLEGQVTPDGKEFHMNLRPEDTQTVTNCPYCKAAGISLQVIRGGSEKCPYCGGTIYFSEGVRA